MSSSTSGAQAHHATSRGEVVLSLDIDRILEDGGARQTVPAEFRYTPDSPLVVTVVFLVEGISDIVWRIGRDLLHQGMSSLSGVGDVQMWPARLEARPTAWLRLASPGMVALFALPVLPLTRWLEDTYGLVPAGTETHGLDWDAVTTGLLKGPEMPSN
ncbi:MULTISPECIES: SsgA family sporulation/cell division regulator [unclassified Streptomyces]|uniref:SsgA family sporulation/cell division regulator n=1 Tax=unclassified Streptomyces TaxID=2593676 RepID=UPI0036E5E9CE